MSPIDRAGHTGPADNSKPRPRISPVSSISTQKVARYRAAVQGQPAVRSDVIARARELAADPNYPSVAIMRHVACRILASLDLSEES